MTTPITPAELNLTIDKASLYTKLNALLSGQFSRPSSDDICGLASNPGAWPLIINVKFSKHGHEITEILNDYKEAGWSVIIKTESPAGQGFQTQYQPQFQPTIYSQRHNDDDLYTALIFTPPMA